MSISLTQTLGDAAKRLVSLPGLVVLGVFLAFRVGELFLLESFVGSLLGWGLEQAGYSVLELQSELAERGFDQVLGVVNGLTNSAVDLPLPVVFLVLVTFPFVAELVHVVGVRAIAAAHGDGNDVPAVTDDLVVAYLRSLFAGFLALFVVVVGFGLLVVPGIVALLAVFFVRQRIVLAGDDIGDAMRESYERFRANAAAVFGLLVLVVLVNAAAIAVGALIPAGGLSGVVYRFFTTLAVVFGLAVTTSAYLQTVVPAESEA